MTLRRTPLSIFYSLGTPPRALSAPSDINPSWKKRRDLKRVSNLPPAAPASMRHGSIYRGILLIRDHLPLGPYSRALPRALWWYQGGAFSYERGTPVLEPIIKHAAI